MIKTTSRTSITKQSSTMQVHCVCLSTQWPASAFTATMQTQKLLEHSQCIVASCSCSVPASIFAEAQVRWPLLLLSGQQQQQRLLQRRQRQRQRPQGRLTLHTQQVVCCSCDSSQRTCFHLPSLNNKRGSCNMRLTHNEWTACVHSSSGPASAQCSGKTMHVPYT